MPHKEAVAALVDELDPAAAALRSVNTVVVLDDGRLKGYSTDGAGFVASLAAQGVEIIASHVGVIGGGGAARAIIDAVARCRGIAHHGRQPVDSSGRSLRPHWQVRSRRLVTSGQLARVRHRGQCDVGRHGFDRASVRCRPVAPGPGRRRHRLPPALHGVPACRRTAPAPARSRDSECWFTRPSCSSDCGPVRTSIQR